MEYRIAGYETKTPPWRKVGRGQGDTEYARVNREWEKNPKGDHFHRYLFSSNYARETGNPTGVVASRFCIWELKKARRRRQQEPKQN